MDFRTLEPARTIVEATAALDFEMPLESGDPRYVNLEIARGGHEASALRRRFERQPSGRWLHAAFASHRGAGKSTELKHLAKKLENRYLPVYFVANTEMDSLQFAMEDLLLVISREVERVTRERNQPLPPDLLKKVEAWFSDVVFSNEQGKSYLAGVQAEAKAEGGIPLIAKLLASLTATFKVESSYRESIKNTLRRFPGTLMTYVNQLLEAAGNTLREEGRDLLLLIDNMDRYDPKFIDELLVKSADRFKALHCHVIVTPLIGLVLKPESQALDSIFTCETMPTVKLREHAQPRDAFSGPGRDVLLQALGKRIDLDALLPEVAVRDRLVAASGGSIRDLLEFAQDATLETGENVIKAKDVEHALATRRQRMRDRIDANGWWEPLKQIARTNRLGQDPAFLEVVFQRFAFQYNGEVWYDVHPLVGELPDMKTVVKPRRPRKKST